MQETITDIVVAHGREAKDGGTVETGDEFGPRCIIHRIMHLWLGGSSSGMRASPEGSRQVYEYRQPV